MQETISKELLEKTARQQRSVLQVHKQDNVLIALKDLAKGEQVNYNETTLTVQENIKAGHKIAMRDFEKGETVVKYGYGIGSTTQAVNEGAHIHSHNLATDLDGSETYHYAPSQMTVETPSRMPTFKGYKRQSGHVGVRNEVWIINTVGCVNQAATRIAQLAKRQFAARADDFIANTHPFGCSQLGDDLNNTRNILASLMQNPNAGGVLVIGLGCENNQLDALIRSSPTIDPSRLRFFNSQEVEDEVEVGLALVEELLDEMATDQREDLPVSSLTLGMKCGGSDGFSGLTANAIVGRVSDKLTGFGGRVILTETPEMFGAEQVLLNRANSEATFNNIVKLVNDFKQYFIAQNQPIYENPSPGNKAGGLTTLEEKSLGAIQKGGKAIINEVIDYGQRASTGQGMTLLQSPGNDAVSSTALAAAGANIVLFTTGRGTPLGFPVPTVKIASNSDLAVRKKHWIDFNAGKILDEDIDIDQCADELFECILAIASGQKTRNEENENREMAIWKNGVTL
ncbi:UxaA family hydrolase [Paraglaciecola chathamensis]|jgi:altronate hydrolase|uniref:Altronate hydrolase n=1 Tax=Paraglaciecola chathamensis S18K6 TaxID=1127672 RepID=A0AAV3UTR3_9ALTE|nr:altronate dehydratase family protein [Paraglaciecola chathamensis]AEE24464.1 Altronate dehydratase [Glaciecola sp. 4H-3-7+YE-5]GAC08440.1 altronate hydrolase [Paraglaciecola chathamensis S18K6]